MMIANRTNVAVFTANTDATPVRAIMTPASAGPMARARLMLTPLRTAADGSCSRGTSSGTIAWKAGFTGTEPNPSIRVNASSSSGGIRCT